MDVIELSKELIRFDTRSPIGNEEEIALFVGNILKAEGFEVDYPSYAQGRLNLIASKGVSKDKKPIVFTGHFDVVPFGDKEWTVNPLGGIEKAGKLYGRGATDMKSAVAAMVVAAIESFKGTAPVGGVKLVLTANEEMGCLGAKALRDAGYELGFARALIVGEPTSNVPMIGHKGGLYLKASTSGKTAHSSTPQLGENAIYKAASAITKIEGMEFPAKKHNLLGFPTINVGTIQGGQNLNSVPDWAEFSIDVRTTPEFKGNEALQYLKEVLGRDVALEKLVDLDAVGSDANDPFVRGVAGLCHCLSVDRKAANYLTDASVLTPWLGEVPTVILGPGEVEMAHQTDEFCYIHKIREVLELYKKIIKL
ncbi:MAG: M20 family metallopeptidase [Allomuricauda sp.]